MTVQTRQYTMDPLKGEFPNSSPQWRWSPINLNKMSQINSHGTSYSVQIVLDSMVGWRWNCSLEEKLAHKE